MAEERASMCEKCGASVYREHIDAGIARYEGGKMLCTHCVVEYERAHDGVDDDESFTPISIEGDGDSKESLSQSRIHVSAGSMLGASGAWSDGGFQRPLEPGKAGATRCRTFHCKLNEGALTFMNGQINEWLDRDTEVAIKFATSTIGIFEGKHADPNLIMTIFY